MTETTIPPLEALLETYSDAVLTRLAADKLDVDVPRARSVLVEAIVAAVSSADYAAATLATIPPPADTILTALLDAPEHVRAVAGFRDEIEELSAQRTVAASDPTAVLTSKRHDLYLPVLATAYADDDLLNPKEAALLATLRQALGMSVREHYLLSYHPSVRASWEGLEDERSGADAYARARDALLLTGLVQTWEDTYGVPADAVPHVRAAMGLELVPSAFGRLLARFTVTQLRAALESCGLALSGSKDERVQRLLDALVRPTDVLASLHSDDIKGLCRDLGLQVSAPKADLIASLVAHFDAGDDLPKDVEPEPEPEPEPRELDRGVFELLLDSLRTDHLHAILSGAGLRRSGTKAERIERIADSRWGEHSLLDHLPKPELVEMLRKLRERVSGTKDELIDRLLEHHKAIELPLGTEEVSEDLGELSSDGA